MLKKRIEALKDFSYSSQIYSREFNKGDIAIVTFQDEKTYKALLGFGNFKEVHNPVKIVRRPVTRSPNGRPIPTAVPTVGKPATEEAPPDGEPVENLCGYCSRSFATVRELSTHIARTHKGEKKVEEIPIAEQSKELPTLEPGTKPEDYVEEKVEEKKIEQFCSNCQVAMVVEGEESIPGQGVKVSWICPICGEKKETLKRSR